MDSGPIQGITQLLVGQFPIGLPGRQSFALAHLVPSDDYDLCLRALRQHPHQ